MLERSARAREILPWLERMMQRYQVLLAGVLYGIFVRIEEQRLGRRVSRRAKPKG